MKKLLQYLVLGLGPGLFDIRGTSRYDFIMRSNQLTNAIPKSFFAKSL